MTLASEDSRNLLSYQLLSVLTAMLLLSSEQNKGLVEFCSNWFCQSSYMYFFKLLDGFVKIDLWISLSCYKNLSKLLNGFVKVVTRIVKVVLCIFRSLPNKTKLKTKISKLVEASAWN